MEQQHCKIASGFHQLEAIPFNGGYTMLYFASDYQEGAHPRIMQRLLETNLESTEGYGTDAYCTQAKELIRSACSCPQAEVHFFIGGTQANATVISAVLASYQGVISARTGHIAGHEAGAIELGGHKVITCPEQDGKISASQIQDLVTQYEQDGNRDHLVMPGMVYLSQPTEYGTIYSLSELTAISEVCRKSGLFLYVDGARLAYALACPDNDVTLPDLARLTDGFYIGGTKCGLLFGEAFVLTTPGRLPHFFSIIKQHGALLAKGRLLGIQFGELFKDGLYTELGKQAVLYADLIRSALSSKGYVLPISCPTNQIFVTLEDAQLKALEEHVVCSFWEKPDACHTVVRIATSWATTQEQVNSLIDLL